MTLNGQSPYKQHIHIGSVMYHTTRKEFKKRDNEIEKQLTLPLLFFIDQFLIDT